MERYDVAVVGAGPAGASAAIFTAKAGRKTLVLDNDKSVTKRALMLNHYGVPDGVGGPEMIAGGKRQAARFGAEIVETEVKGLQRSDEGFTVQTADGRTFAAQQVILATGFSVALAEQVGAEVRPGTEPRVAKVVAVDVEGRTTVPGLWAAGTCAGTSVHTIITAGDGARVAINLLSELQGSRYVDHDVLPKDA